MAVGGNALPRVAAAQGMGSPSAGSGQAFDSTNLAPCARLVSLGMTDFIWQQPMIIVVITTIILEHAEDEDTASGREEAALSAA